MTGTSTTPFEVKTAYSAGDVARLLSCSKNTVLKAMDQGELPCYRIPGSRWRRIHHQQLLAYLDDQPGTEFARRQLRAAEAAEAP
jgi:excisionase family DNA binding protein